ncbi:MFS-type transporter protein [Rutstroemia sp. NJR-2017a BVV2]|nr:MFS-type transporter protein [Rutstroemia sp. NJR-2017a BVV2]
MSHGAMDPMDNDDFIPGTSRLVEDLEQSERSHLLKHGDIVLDPQPTSSPDDPLNWSPLRKYWHVALVCFITGLTAATANDAGSAQDGMNEELGFSYDIMNIGAGVLFIGIGYWTLLISPAAWLYGRRIPYLVCLTLGVVGAIWLARVKTTSDSIWNQLFVGASEACAEANVQLSLSDIFFQHQRGTVLGIYVLSTSIGTYLGPLIAGYIGGGPMGWRWIGWWSVIISTCTIIVCYFTLEETMFERPESAYETPAINGLNTSETSPNSPTNEKETALTSIPSDTPPIPTPPPTRKTFRDRIRLITPASNLRGTGFKQYCSRLLHTLRIFSFPAVWYSGLQWGSQDAWLTFYLTLEEDNWTSPPYNYSSIGSGLMNIPCLIGAIIGCFWGGYLSDVFVLWYSKRYRNGIQEAEDRLWMMYPCAIFSPLGMFIFGLGTAYVWSWPVSYVGLGFIGFGWGCAGDLSMSYLMDAYPEMVLEGMVGVSVINNTIGCIFTFAASPWLETGTANTFIAIGVLDFVFVMCTWPMMVYGKRCRKWTKRRYLEFVRSRDAL